MITRSLKSLWQSDVLLGASVGAATSGLLVVLALVVAPLLDGSPRQTTADARTGTANLPAPARAAESRATDDDRAAKRVRAAVTRRDDTASLPAPTGDDKPRRTVDAPDRQPAPIPVSPATTITKVPVVPALSAPSAGPSPAGVASSITPATARTGLRLRVRAASFGRESGEPELRLTMGISGQTGTATLPEQVTVRLRPEIPAHPEDDATPLALNADVDVVDQPQTAAGSQGDGAPVAMGLRVRMSLVPATAEVATIDEDAQGDGNSNIVKLAVPLTVFNAGEDTAIPGVPTDVPTEPAPTDGTGGTPAEPAPSEPAPSQPGPSEPAPSQPAPSEPAPSEPAPSDPAPSEPAPSDPAPSEPAPSDPAPSEPAPSDPAPSEPAPSEPAPEPSTITVQEIHVPLLITLEPVTTVENTTLPLPSDVPADTIPSEGMRVTISVQNALNEETVVDPRGAGDPGTTDPAPDAPVTPSTEPGTTDPAPADGGAVAVAESDASSGYGPDAAAQ